MSASITVDTTWAERAMERLAHVQGRTVMDMHRQMFGEHIKRMQSSRVPVPKSQAQGRAAVRRDLSRIVVGVKKAGVSKTPDAEGYYHYVSETGARWKYPQDLHDIGGAKLDQYHRAQRNKRGGVSGRDRTNMHGGKLVINKLHVRQATARKYMRDTARRVGRLKAGWNPAASAMRLRIPSWLARHGHGLGRFRHVHGMNVGYLEAVNRVPYSEPRLRSFLAFSETLQAKRINHILRAEMRKLAKQYNSERAA